MLSGESGGKKLAVHRIRMFNSTRGATQGEVQFACGVALERTVRPRTQKLRTCLKHRWLKPAGSNIVTKWLQKAEMLGRTSHAEDGITSKDTVLPFELRKDRDRSHQG